MIVLCWCPISSVSGEITTWYVIRRSNLDAHDIEKELGAPRLLGSLTMVNMPRDWIFQTTESPWRLLITNQAYSLGIRIVPPPPLLFPHFQRDIQYGDPQSQKSISTGHFFVDILILFVNIVLFR